MEIDDSGNRVHQVVMFKIDLIVWKLYILLYILYTSYSLK